MGVPRLVNPDGRVMVGLPLMLKGEVKRINANSASASWPSVSIFALVGEAMNCAGMINNSMD